MDFDYYNKICVTSIGTTNFNNFNSASNSNNSNVISYIDIINGKPVSAFNIPNTSINIFVEKYSVDKYYHFQDNNSELGIYSPKNKFFKCTGLNLKSLFFESVHLISNPFMNIMFHQLKHINLEFNKIEKITIFPPQLETLVCGYNKFKRLENLPPTVKVIIAFHNLIEYVNVENCNNIKNINLSNNKLTSQSELLLPSHIEFLDLSYNKLAYINFTDKFISNLNMNYNLIDKIYELPNELNILSISNNELTNFELPNKLKDKLICLNLTKNKLVHLGGNFVILTDLLISNNNLEKIQATFSKLQKLHFSYNNIKHFDIPSTVTALCCIGTKITEIKINDQMNNVYLPFETLIKITPFNKFIKLYKLNHIYVKEGDDDHIKNIAARVIQRTIKRFNNKSSHRWENIFSKEDLDKSDIIITI